MGKFSLIKERRNLYQVLYIAGREFYTDDGFNLAAGLSFFAILSTIPLALIVISVLGHLLGQQDQLFDQVSHWIYVTVPNVQPDFIAFLRQLVDKKVTSGWIGLGFLIFAASLLFTNIEHILDKVFRTSKTRNFWHSRVFSIVLLFFTAFLFFVPSQLNLLVTHFPAKGWLPAIAGFFSGDISYFIAHALVFFLLLNFVPNQAMPKKKIALGSVVFTLCTLAARKAFQWYMAIALERYTFMYGSLSVLVVLIIWIYYLSLLFIFCAEIVSALQQIYPQESQKS